KIDIKAIDKDGDRLDEEVDAGIAGAGDGAEPDDGEGHQDNGGGDDAQDGDGRVDEGLVLAIYGQEETGETVEEDEGENGHGEAELYDLPDEGDDLVLHTLADDIAHHGIGGGGKGPGEDTEEPEDVPHGIADRQGLAAMVFDEDVEEDPGDDADDIL